MADAVENNKPNSRQRLVERYRKTNPDLNPDDENLDLAGMAADELDSFDKDREARAELDGKMNALFKSNGNASRIFIGWANGQDPIENLIEMYGDDLLEALQSPEGKDKFKAALDKWRTGKQADEEHSKEYDANIDESVKTLVVFADKYNLSDEKVAELVEDAWEMGSDILNGKYTEEILEMVYKAENYESAVEDAREEGRVDGKNENIRRELRKSKPATSLPPTTGGQEAVGTEGTMEKPKSGKLSMFGGIPVNKK